MLQGIGKEIAQNLFQFIKIQPHPIVGTLLHQFQLDALDSCRILKGSHLLAQFINHIHLCHLQAQLIRLQLVEVEHLVDEPQHSVHTHAHMVQRAMHRLRQSLVGIQRHQRTGDDGDWVSELVGNIGKESHVHLLGEFLPLTLLLFLQEMKAVGSGPEIERIDNMKHQGDDAGIEQPCRRRLPRSRLDDDFYRSLRPGRLIGRGYQAQAECIFSRCKVGVMSLPAVGRHLPILIIPLQLVLAHQCRTATERGIIEIKPQVVLIIGKSIAIQMRYLVGNGKFLAIRLLDFHAIDIQQFGCMNTGWSLHEIGVHRLLRHKHATNRTAKHHIAIRRQADGIIIKLPVIPVLTSRQQTVHHKSLAFEGDKEDITHGGYPKLAIPVFYHSPDMGIVQHLDTGHGSLLHIDEVESVSLGTQPHHSMRILLCKGRVEVAVLRHASHLHLLHLSRFRRKDGKMHTLHKQQDISIGQFLHLRFMVKIGTWNRDGIRLQVVKAETQEIFSITTYIKCIAHLQAITQHRLQHGRFVKHIGTFVADTATCHLMSANHPGMLIIILHDVVQIDFLGCGNRIEDISE